MKYATIILCLLMILSGLSLISISEDNPNYSEGKTAESEENPITITTDKEIYYQGEPVNIKISGKYGGSSTHIDWGYVITDENGYWVRDPPNITTCDVRLVNGDMYYLWDQKYDLVDEYDLDGNLKVHYKKNGEQVPAGRYYIHFLMDMDVFTMIEIVDDLQ
jgi:hypothetical protein